MRKSTNEKGVYQLDNGYWAYRFIIKINGKNKIQRRSKGLDGKPFKTQKQAVNARKKAIEHEHKNALNPVVISTEQKKVKEIFNEYCQKGRNGKAYSTIRKQDSLWENHIKIEFGNKYIDDINVSDITDYLERLYYLEDRAYSYVESFLKMFYLIYGQAFSRGYIDSTLYNKMCVNKDTRIHMPKMKINDDKDIVTFNENEFKTLDNYFKDTNAETAYMIGKYTGLRINECYGLKWDNIDFENDTIIIDRQMYYHEGVIKLMPVKTRCGKRKIYMCETLKIYLTNLKNNIESNKEKLEEQRNQKQVFIKDIDGQMISSLNLINTLPNGKIQTVNSMKYHSKQLKDNYNISFKYHYLRHSYGTKLAILNTPLHILCNQMGHSNHNVTQKYYLAISQEGINELKNNLNKI